MKIGVDAREFVEQGKTGIRRYLENLLAPLTGKADFNLVLFVNRRDFIPENLCAPSVKLIALPALPTQIVDQVALPHLAQQENIDIFFSPYYKVPLSGKFKRIITVHDIMFLRQEGLNSFTRFLIARQLRASARKADIIMVASDFTAADLSDFMPSLKPKIHRIYHDISAAWLKPVAPAALAAARERYAHGQPFFLYAGNFRPHKNVPLLLQAFAQLVAERQAAERLLLLAGGDAHNLPRISELIRKLGLEKHALICPNLPDEDLRGLYAAADWFITASSYEGFGFPLLEAMTAGCPVICHPRTSIPEVVGKAALELSALTVEEIIRVAKLAFNMKPDERRIYVEKGEQQALLFSPGTTAEQFAALLHNNLFPEHPPRP